MLTGTDNPRMISTTAWEQSLRGEPQRFSSGLLANDAELVISYTRVRCYRHGTGLGSRVPLPYRTRPSVDGPPGCVIAVAWITAQKPLLVGSLRPCESCY